MFLSHFCRKASMALGFDYLQEYMEQVGAGKHLSF